MPQLRRKKEENENGLEAPMEPKFLTLCFYKQDAPMEQKSDMFI